MGEQKTRKVLEISDGSLQFACMKHEEKKKTPYYLYRVWWNMGMHRELIGKYDSIDMVLGTLHDVARGYQFY